MTALTRGLHVMEVLGLLILYLMFHLFIHPTKYQQNYRGYINIILLFLIL